jgi:hypothetical protein
LRTTEWRAVGVAGGGVAGRGGGGPLERRVDGERRPLVGERAPPGWERGQILPVPAPATTVALTVLLACGVYE